MTRLMLALGFAVTLAGCGDDAPQSPTSASVPEISVDSTSRLFAGTLSAREAQFYSFTLPQESGVFVTLASVTTADNREATGINLGVGLGVPRGTECVMSTRVVTTAALTPQIREITPRGVRCVSVYDPATLPAPVRYAVRIGYYQ